MGAKKPANVGGTAVSALTAAASAGGTKSHFQVFAADGTTPKTNPTPFNAARTVGSGGKLSIDDGAIWLFLGKPSKITAVDASANTLTIPSHGLTSRQKVLLRNTGGALPSPLSPATQYWVDDITPDTFKLYTQASGGTAVDISGVGTGVHSIIREGEIDDTVLITMLGEGTGEFDDTDVIKVGEDMLMTNAADIATFSDLDWDAAVLW